MPGGSRKMAGSLKRLRKIGHRKSAVRNCASCTLHYHDRCILAQTFHTSALGPHAPQAYTGKGSAG